ncbi:MAG TPA: ABC transporter permease subunit [Kofleriaceae bacterium]|jgi:ABC-2 type transport system permease protein
MRATRIIFWRELRAYFRAPFTWVIAWLLLLVDGILFQAFALAGEQLSADVLANFFRYSSGVAMAAGILLSFRLISEERQTHSLVLLNTSPVRDSEIVAGKFLAALTFLAFLLALSIYLPLLIKVNGKISTAQIAVGYLGLFLIGAMSLGIGMFASSLARQQIVAGVIALAILVVMFMLYPFAKKLDEPVRYVFSNLDMWWIHFQEGFMRGILNLKDIVYYLAMTYFFLLLTTKTLEAKRWQ